MSGGRRRRLRRFALCARALVAALVAALGIAVWPVGIAVGADGAGEISGHVTATSGPVCVLALDANGQSVADPAASNGSGNYALGNVPAGQWTVEFFPDDGCNGAVTADAFQFYAGSSTRAGATPVTVVAGQTTGGIDATMAEAAQITGSVTDTAGGGLSGICVVLEDTAGRPVLRELTDPLGLYTLDRLPAGQFVVEFVADGCVGAAERYASQYYPGAASRLGAATITLHPGDQQDGLDAALAPAPVGGGKAPSPPPAGGGGSSGGRSSSGGGSSSGPTHRRAHIVLLAGSRRGYLADHRGRLHLRLRCERPGPTCAGSIKLAVLARGARRTGRMVGHKAFRLRADSRGRTVLVGVRTQQSRLRLLIHLHNQAGSQVITTVRVRYPRAVKRAWSIAQTIEQTTGLHHESRLRAVYAGAGVLR